MKHVRLEIEDSFDEFPYRRSMRGLEVDGFPWIPLVGRNSFLNAIASSPWHTHKGCIEIVYCQRGTCEYESRGETWRLKPGSVFVSRPNEVHRMVSIPRGLVTYDLLFKIPEGRMTGFVGDEIRFVERKLRKMPRLFEVGNLGSQFARFFRLIERGDVNESERHFRVLIASLSLILSILDASKAQMLNGGSLRVRALAEEMRQYPDQDYPIEALASRIGCSMSYLISSFKATTGYSPHAYLIKCRVDYAKEMLRMGDRMIADIAGALAFPSPQHFATQFRNVTGMSPTQWLRDQGLCK